ncbi:MAG: hypothetical protein BMS9Abin07_0481 [Acidimicrobiia bacterium]|nr:MAG: hypothetical protein BMS9Abin07_0481 [Acidimicrobiia bacterium]
MLRNVFTKTIWERRWAMFGWVLGGLALTTFIVALYPIIRDSADFIDLIKEMPDELIAFAGIDPEIYTTGYGYLQAQMYSLLGPLLILILAIGMGAGATAAEESNGTADLLLATSVSRSRVVVDKSAALAVMVAMVILSFVVVLLIGQLAVQLQLSIWGIIGGNVGLFLLGLFFGTMAMAIGAWSGKRALAAGIAGGIAGLSFFLNAFAPLVEGLEAIQPLLPFYWYSNGTPLLDGPTSWQLLLAAGVVLFSAAAALAFRRRDIGVVTQLAVFARRGTGGGRTKSSKSPLLGSISGKTIWDKRRSFWWWLAGIGTIASITIALFPSVRDADGQAFENLIDSYPPELLAVFGITDPASLLTGAGIVSSRVYSSIGLVIVLAFAIGMGKAALAGEEKDGTADLLFSTPLPRDRIVAAKAAAMLTLLLALLVGVMVIVGIGDILVGLDLSLQGLVAANLGMALLAFLFGAVAMAVGAAGGRPGVAIGVASGLGVVTFLLNGFGAIVDWLGPLRPLTPFYWYQGDSNPLEQSLGWQQPLMFAVGLVFVGTAALLFRRRDIGT